MSIFRSIKTRLLVFGLCISLIPISVITTIFYINARSTLKKQILKDFKAIAESKKQHLLSFVDAKKGRAIDFSSDGFIRDSLEAISQGGDQSYVVASLNRHLNANKNPLDSHIIAIDVMGSDGMIVSSTREESIGRKVSDYEKLHKLINGEYTDTSIREPHYDNPHEGINIDVSALLFSRSRGMAIGFIRLHYDTSAFNSITNNRTGMGETGEVYIVNRDKLMLTNSRFTNDAVLKQMVDTEPLRRIIEDDITGMTGIYPDYRGVPVIGVSVDMPEYGWILITEMDAAEAFAPLRGLGIVALIVGSACGAAAIGVGIIFSHSTARPINRLKHATEEIAGGSLEHRVDIIRKDEIGMLANSFNSMADELMKKDMAVLAENTMRRQTEEALRTSKERLTHAQQIAHMSNWEWDIINNVATCSDEFYSILGLKPRQFDLTYEKFMDFIYPEDRGLLEEKVNKALKDGKPYSIEYRIVRLDGTVRVVHVETEVLLDENGNPKKKFGTMHDITERKQAEDLIKASLKEKEVLLREVHHRVKNNLQIISSLLDMSSMQTENQEAMDLFADSRNRVYAMAIIHSQLYRSERFDQINMGEHIQELSKKLLQIYSMENTITLEIKSNDMYLTVNQAIPCALVLNELITNVCKHAYREGQKGVINISMQKPDDNTFSLRVKDDGVGIPEEFDIGKVKSLGLSLVRNLVYNQLKGKIDVRRNKGTEFLVYFKLEGAEA